MNKRTGLSRAYVPKAHAAILAAGLLFFPSGLLHATASLRVIVKDQASTQFPKPPVVGATVLAITQNAQGQTDGSASRIGTTDSSGQVNFNDLLDGRNYVIYATKHGFSPVLKDQSGEPRYGYGTLPDAVINLNSGLTGMGQVSAKVNLSSYPKLVEAEITRNGYLVAKGVGMIVSAGANIITIDNVPPDAASIYQMKVTVTDDNLQQSKTVTSAVTAGGNTDPNQLLFDFVSGGGSTAVAFEGIVTEGPSGTNRLINVDVYLKKHIGGGAFGEIYHTITNAQGEYSFTAIPAATYSLEFSKTGYAAQVLPSGGAGYAYDGVNRITTSPMLQTVSATLNGKALVNGVALPGASVEISGNWDKWLGNDNFSMPDPECYSNKGGSSYFTTTTNATGDFSFTNLLPGNYTLRVTHPNSNLPTTFNDGANRLPDFAPTASCPSAHAIDDQRLTLANNGVSEVRDPTGAIIGTPGAVIIVNVPDPQASSSVAFDGTVRENTGGTPVLPGVDVFLKKKGTGGAIEQIYQTLTDASGNYQFSGIPNGDYILEFEKGGHLNKILDNGGANYNYTGSKITNNVNLDLVNGTISGRAEEQGTGFGIAGAFAELRPDPSIYRTTDPSNDPYGIPSPGCFSDKEGDSNLTTTTNANGDFSFSGVAPGNYVLRVTSPTHQVPVTLNFGSNGILNTLGSGACPGERTSDDERLTVKDNGQSQRFSIGGGTIGGAGSLITVIVPNNGAGTAAFDGQVTQAPGGSPLAGVEVILKRLVGTVFAETYQAFTDGSGNYAFYAIPNGTYVLEFEKFGFIKKIDDNSGSNHNFSGTTITRNISLSAYNGVLNGTVYSDGTPLANAFMELFPDDGLWKPYTSCISEQGGESSFSTTSDGSGQFSFSNLGPGNYVLRAKNTSTLRTGTYNFGLDNVATFNPGASCLQERWGDDKRITISNGAAQVYAPDGTPLGAPGVALVVDVPGAGGYNPSASFEGTVTQTGGSPLPGVDVQLKKHIGGGAFGEIYHSVTNAQGNYSFYGIPQGTYTLEFSKTGYIQLIRPANGAGHSFNGSATITDSPVMSVANGTISGRVLKNGTAVASATLELFPDGTVWRSNNSSDLFAVPASVCFSDKGGEGFYSTMTDASGNFSFTGLLPGNYTLKARHNATDTEGTFNHGTDGLVNFNTSGCYNERINDDRRLTIDNNVANVFDPQGNPVGTPGSPIDVVIPDLSQGGTNGFVAPTMAFTGTVTGSGAGNPTLLGVQVKLIDQTNGGFFYSFTDHSGNYAFFNIPSGTYNLQFEKDGYDPKSLTGYVYDGVNLQTVSTALTLGAGGLCGVVSVDGSPIPEAIVEVFGDPHVWSGSDSLGNAGATCNSFPGTTYRNLRTQFDGTFNTGALAPGNYMLRVVHPFSPQSVLFNAGADNVMDFDTGGTCPTKRINDDFRISAGQDGLVTVYDLGGNIVSPAGNCLAVQMEAPTAVGTGGTAATIQGTLRFDTVVTIDQSNPIVVVAREDLPATETDLGDFGYVSVTGTGQTLSYSITVPSGKRYILEVQTQDYGVFGLSFNQAVDFTFGTITTATRDFHLVQSGTIQGTIKLPNGQTYTPQPGVEIGVLIEVFGEDVPTYRQGELRSDGVFEISGLNPGRYTLRVVGQDSSFPYGERFLRHIGVQGNQTTNVLLQLTNSILVRPSVTVPSLPGGDTGFFRILALPAGSDFKENSLNFLFDPEDGVTFFGYKSGSWDDGYLGEGLYDFYFCYVQDFGPPDSGMSPNMFMTVLSRKTQLISQALQADLNPPNGTMGILLSMSGSLGTGVLKGSILGQNIFRQIDMDIIKTDFDKFIELIPRIFLIDSLGKIIAVSMEVPAQTQAALDAWMAAANSGDLATLKTVMTQYPPAYRMEGLAAGTYTAVITTPNYPPQVKPVSIASGSETTLNVTLDSAAGGSGGTTTGGSLAGTIRDSSTNQVIANVTVSVRNIAYSRTVQTDASGVFRLDGIPLGVYRIQATKNGYAPEGTNKILESGTVTVDLTLKPGAGSFEGTVRDSQNQAYDGAKIVAFNETKNSANLTGFIPVIEALTESDGGYTLTGLIPGDTYRVTVIVPGYKISSVTRQAVSGLHPTAMDFTLESVAPRLNIEIGINGQIASFTIASSKALSTITGQVSSGTTFNATGATDLTLSAAPANNWTTSFTASGATGNFVLRVVAYDGVNTTTLDVPFSLNAEESAYQPLDEEIAEGGTIALDDSGEDPTFIDIPPGGLSENAGEAFRVQGVVSQPLIGGFASILMQRTGRSISQALLNVASNIIVSDVYTIELANVTIEKELTLGLAYDETTVTDPSTLRIYQYNSATDSWTKVLGTRTVDPVNGTISIEIDEDIFDTVTASSFRSGFSRNGVVTQAATTGSQTGTFAVFNAAPAPGIAYNNSSVEAFNFPNPFDLKTKTITSSVSAGAVAAGLTSTTGTIIHYKLPQDKGGAIKLLIYNLAGELVRELDEGTRAGGQEYYASWDGKTSDGSDVASGVYFCMLKKDGEKLKTFKMAVIK